MELVGGMDGCRGGWVLVTSPAKGTRRSTVTVVADLKETVAIVDAGWVSVIGIDIPIGLPDAGPRPCDVAARRMIGHRARSVFPAPLRGSLGSQTYEDACARSRELGGKAMSRQVFAILPKVEAVDQLITPERQRYLVEVHPEVSFTVLAGRPMVHPKSNSEGRLERLAFLRKVFPDVDDHVRRRDPRVKPDDILDAFAAAWTARRLHSGKCTRIGGGERDGRNLRMEIVA